ncbi:DNA damage-regulated autophagy modulator protein 1 isoform X1 [Festucalex cinctus]
MILLPPSSALKVTPGRTRASVDRCVPCGGSRKVCASCPSFWWCGPRALSSCLTSSRCSDATWTCCSPTLGIATIYGRFKFVEKLNEETRVVSPRLNKAALVLGMLACLGMCVVATFQETTVTAVHDAGALLFFATGVLYIFLQSAISYHLFPYGSSMAVCRARLAVAVIALLAFFPTVICAFFVKQKDLHRDAESKDYPFHVASAVCEWIVAFSFVCFFLTYIDDFKLFTLRVKTEMG